MQNSGLILLPIDLRRCPLDVFVRIKDFAQNAEAHVILLHVVHLNIVPPENGIYAELASEAEWYLQRLAERHIARFALTLVRVRFGNPAEQILAEAAEQQVDLILLPSLTPDKSSRAGAFWKRLTEPRLSRGMQKIIREATCGVFVVNPKEIIDIYDCPDLPIKVRAAVST